ncbi:MAG: hypothetical protein K6A63_04555 [Acholeplasmatales bacterium]|nr:hypothetical protein [Acholeplasmatales bacterium]
MKSGSRICLIINVVASFMGAIITFIGGILCLKFSSHEYYDDIVKNIQNGKIETDLAPNGTVYDQATAVQNMLGSIGVALIIVFIGYIICAILSLIAYKKNEKGLYVAVMIAGVAAGNYICLAAGILGILAIDKEIKENNLQANTLEEEPKEESEQAEEINKEDDSNDEYKVGF